MLRCIWQAAAAAAVHPICRCRSSVAGRLELFDCRNCAVRCSRRPRVRVRWAASSLSFRELRRRRRRRPLHSVRECQENVKSREENGADAAAADRPFTAVVDGDYRPGGQAGQARQQYAGSAAKAQLLMRLDQPLKTLKQQQDRSPAEDIRAELRKIRRNKSHVG